MLMMNLALNPPYIILNYDMRDFILVVYTAHIFKLNAQELHIKTNCQIKQT